MSNGAKFYFVYTYQFYSSLGGKDANAIVRYSDGDSYLWASCLDEPDAPPKDPQFQAEIIESEL